MRLPGEQGRWMHRDGSPVFLHRESVLKKQKKTSAKEVMFSCLFVCLCVSQQNDSKTLIGLENLVSGQELIKLMIQY